MPVSASAVACPDSGPSTGPVIIPGATAVCVSGGTTRAVVASLRLVAHYLITERIGSRVEILGTDDCEELLGRHSNRKE